MTSLSERRQVTVWLTEAIAAGARQDRACAVLGLSARTLQRWQADEIELGPIEWTGKSFNYAAI